MIINRVIGGANIITGVSVTVHGAVYEDITLSDGQVIATDANGEGTAVVSTGEITLTGSVSGQSFTETVTDATTDIYCMPKGALYWYGNECIDVTGGWSADDYVWASRTTEAGIKNSDSMYIPYTTQSSESYCRILGTVNPIRLTDYNKICIKNITSGSSMAFEFMACSKKNKISDGSIPVDKYLTSSTLTINEIDISSVSGDYYTLFFNTENRSRWGRVYAVWLE